MATNILCPRHHPLVAARIAPPSYNHPHVAENAVPARGQSPCRASRDGVDGTRETESGNRTRRHARGLQRAFETTLDRYVVQQASTPHPAVGHIACNSAYALYFTLIASETADDVRTFLPEHDISGKEADAVMLVAQQHAEAPAIGPYALATHLRGAGVKPSMRNLQALMPLVAAAYRDACVAASESVSGILALPLPAALGQLLDPLRYNSEGQPHEAPVPVPVPPANAPSPHRTPTGIRMFLSRC